MRTLVIALVLAGAASSVGCAGRLEPLPLRPEPVPYADTLPIEEPPAWEQRRILSLLAQTVPWLLSEPVAVPEGEALNRTHFDDVVPSSWFEPRVGYRDVTPREIVEGPVSPGGAPASSGPLVVKEAKTEGATPGFVAEDAKGDTYVVKFDLPRFRPMQLAAGIIVNRFMWAAGYHVPEDYIFRFDGARLTVAEDAVIETPRGERPMTEEDVAAVLGEAGEVEGGGYLALASRHVPGIPKGPFFLQGRNERDPNDHYRHEHRRELRGLKAISSWLNNVDIRAGNTISTFVEPGYLRHYFIDFGASLGSGTTHPRSPKDEVERPIDLYAGMARILSLGFYRAGWEDEPREVIHPTLGYLRGASFRPAAWDTYWAIGAFHTATPADAYWGTKIVAAFTGDQIRAVVEAGRLPEPWLTDTLTSILKTRRDILVDHWYGEVTPVEEPAVARQGPGRLTLTFRDLGLEEEVRDPDDTRYVWELEHEALDREGEGTGEASGRARQALEVTWSGDSGGRGIEGRDALATLEIRVERPERSPREATIWLRWTGRRYEVVGLEH